MCLATVYKESDDTVILKNTSRIDVDGEKLILRDIMGQETVVEGKILMVDLANSIVKSKQLLFSVIIEQLQAGCDVQNRRELTSLFIKIIT